MRFKAFIMLLAVHVFKLISYKDHIWENYILTILRLQFKQYKYIIDII